MGWDDLRHSYRAGCPVGPAQLRALRVSYWGFDGRARVGWKWGASFGDYQHFSTTGR